MTLPAVELEKIGTAVWLDDLSRELILSGELETLINDSGVIGVTTNPAIFASAMSKGTAYDEQLAQLADKGVSASQAVFSMAVDDVRNACDVFSSVSKDTDGQDGRVSLEVDPRFAGNVEATVQQAVELAGFVGRDNLLIKIPATDAGIKAIPLVLEAGISVNVTLIFSVERYSEVIDAYSEGLRLAAASGRDLSKIFSVASFFISRVDAEIDSRLKALGTQDAADLEGKAGIANARLAYAKFLEFFNEKNQQWAEFASLGAHVQRPLWASTSTKNPEYPDTLYVTELAGADTVNTMPRATLDALNDHGKLTGDTLTGTEKESAEIFQKLSDAGIDLADVFAQLEREGVEKFIESWEVLIDTIGTRLSNF